MINDLQKASIWKRASAYLFDLILLVTLAVGLAALVSWMTGYDGYSQRLADCYDRVGKEYGVELRISEAEYEKFTPEMKEAFNKASEALSKDEEALYTYNMIVNLALVIITASTLVATMVTDFVIPLFFKNGQTLGKKIFGIAVMRIDGVKVSPLIMFIRTLLGKYTIELMIPLLIAVLVFFGALGITGTMVILLIGLLQIILLIATRGNSAIHDTLAHTVVVDMASQRIFDTPEAMLEYKKRVHSEEAASREYP